MQSLFKSRAAIRSRHATDILFAESHDGAISYQIANGYEDQATSVLRGEAVVLHGVEALMGGDFVSVDLVRLVLNGSDHVDPEMADPADPKLLPLFRRAWFYQIGDSEELIFIVTGEVVGVVL